MSDCDKEEDIKKLIQLSIQGALWEAKDARNEQAFDPEKIIRETLDIWQRVGIVGDKT